VSEVSYYLSFPEHKEQLLVYFHQPTLHYPDHPHRRSRDKRPDTLVDIREIMPVILLEGFGSAAPLALEGSMATFRSDDAPNSGISKTMRVEPKGNQLWPL
jgi:hypothetical protein